jgi:hypothetical protein
LLYDIAYLERQELIGIYYFTQSLLQDIENTFIELPANDPRIEECLERMEEIQKLLKEDQSKMNEEGVTRGDMDDFENKRLHILLNKFDII